MFLNPPHHGPGSVNCRRMSSCLALVYGTVVQIEEILAGLQQQVSFIFQELAVGHCIWLSFVIFMLLYIRQLLNESWILGSCVSVESSCGEELAYLLWALVMGEVHVHSMQTMLCCRMSIQFLNSERLWELPPIDSRKVQELSIKVCPCTKTKTLPILSSLGAGSCL